MPAIEVPGATVHYQVAGTGPTLLLIPGGGGDADTVSGLAARLADRFAVISHDRRGLSRSTLADPGEHPSIATHADDAARVIAAVGAPAAVFGSSLGAIIALDLLARHPDSVRFLVAHEPPLPQVLTVEGRRQARAVQELLEQPGPQWRDVALALAIDHSDTEPGVEIPRPTEREFANQRFFQTRDAPTAHRYHLDLDALRPNTSRLVLAGGTKSAHAFPHHCALALAEALSVPFEEFPGDHVGLVTQPTTFATRLAELLP
ncbi:alpha/beta fold hydrolase [Actinokineospora cianjurensis]|uniref:Pimeloyl-ACP methyl ester carboxylesterase n=1 Tax=Actinokineospora cianjurensis TaxID=585224 RepID=A0A421B4U3_9PSEU|nr:alpha/beta hydrolase [Actinokineospora cianjurensis]RLK59369.1 pimeloyl-ACP methyl ester carboxylesterase [Actinokineospora cianjurensis]